MSRKLVLSTFKSLHRTREEVFHGDTGALQLARTKINQEFKNSKNIGDSQKIKDLIKYARDVETELRSFVIQAIETKPGVYKVKVRKDTVKLDNVPFKECSDSK